MGKVADDLFREMQSPTWIEVWDYLSLVEVQFSELGLAPGSKDLEIWQKCQTQQVVFITNNRNEDSMDSLESMIRLYNTPASLPVFTIGDFDRLRESRAYAEDIVEQLYDYLLDIDRVRGAGRLYLP